MNVTAGNIIEETNYDAWGRVRNADDWTYTNAQTLSTIFRGYTGHEMLPEFGLINMNGRMYDPLLGRMLSPDNYVQDPSNAQNYNRYAYVLNNPLKYNDPSGNDWTACFATMLDIIAIPAKVMTGGVMWANDQINGKTSSTGYFNKNYIFGNEAPYYVPTNSIIYDDYDQSAFFEQIGANSYEWQEEKYLWGHWYRENPYGDDYITSPIYKTRYNLVQRKAQAGGGQLSTKEWGTGDYMGVGSMLMGATGNDLGRQMNNLSRFAPIKTMDGRVVAPATRFYKFGPLSGAAATKLGAGLRVGGNLLGGVGIGYTMLQMYSGQASVGKGAVDIGFGIVGFMGPIGLGVSAIYFTGDALIPGGWQATPQHMYDQIQRNSNQGVWFGAHNHFK